MKKRKLIKLIISVILFNIGVITSTNAQIEQPVHWAYGLKKLSTNTYEVHLQATIDDGWHIYAQKQLPEAIAVPTKINISKAAGLQPTGKPAEFGKKDTYTVKEAGITNYEYAGKVDFVQKVTIATGLKEIKGTITFQACTHEKCLAEQTISFTVPVP